MTEKYRFFNGTVDDDRLYQASEYADYFATLVTNGVWAEDLDALKVTGHGGEMKSIIATGKAFINGYYYENDTPLEMVHAAAHSSLDRIDRVVLRLDVSEANRYLKAFVITGTPGSPAVAPVVTREGQVYEISLAQVLIPAGQSFIETANITDERSDAANGGYARFKMVHGWNPAEIVIKSANYSVSLPDKWILVSTPSGDVTITLPAASSCSGRAITIKKVDVVAHVVFVETAGSETIDGASNLGIGNPNEAFTVVSNGSNWFIV